VLDTRKTTPGLRDLEKWAVAPAGREPPAGLWDMYLVKDNHSRRRLAHAAVERIARQRDPAPARGRGRDARLVRERRLDVDRSCSTT
jgi:nicotinate-nucleotide pyrophosphorylase (carboxylating)